MERLFFLSYYFCLFIPFVNQSEGAFRVTDIVYPMAVSSFFLTCCGYSCCWVCTIFCAGTKGSIVMCSYFAKCNNNYTQCSGGMLLHRYRMIKKGVQ